MKKLFQRQKGGHKPAEGSPVPSQVPTPAATPRSMVPPDPTPPEENWVMLTPSNGATPATQLPPGAGHDPAGARGGYDLASVHSHTEHSSPPSQTATPAGGKLQKKGGFFSRHTDLHGKEVSHASGPPQSQPRTSETHHRDHSRRHEEAPTGAPGELTRMIGYLTGFAADDWTVVLEVCERAAASEANAREAAKALRREFKYAEPSAQMAAARLWAIMLRYSSEIFIAQTTTKKFLEVVEEVCTSSKTTPVVRERLLEVIAGAAFAHPVPERSGFAGSWRRIKAPGQPDEGIPFDDLDPMFTPPAPKAQRQPYHQHNQHPSYDRNPFPPPDTVRQRAHAAPGGGVTAAQQYAAQYGHHAPQAQQGYGNYQATNGGRREREVRVPTAEEEIRNLYSQCELARNNARVLSEALGFAKPIELGSNLVIKEFHTKCMGSQEFIVAQIPWATANSDRSREKLQEQQAIAASIQGEEGQQQQTPETAEEQLLAALLQANQDLVEVFKQYDELERLGMHEQEENEVALRSLHETKLDRTQIQYYSADGSFQLEAPGGGVGAGGSGSRSPSPSLLTSHSSAAHGTRPVPQLSHQGSNVSYVSHQGGHPPLPQIATQPPTPAALGQNGPQIHQLPPTPVDLLGSGIVRDPTQQQQYNQYAQQRGQPPQPVPHPNQQQYPQQYPQHPQQHGVMAPPPPAPMGPRRPRSRTPSPTRKERADRERERGSAGGGSERDSSSEDNNTSRYGVSPSQLSAGYPAVPSQKALGKRKAPELPQQPEQNDLLRTVGVYGDSTTTLDNIQDDSEDDSPAAVATRAARPKWLRQPVSYVYDAAEERRKERENMQQQARSQPAVPTVNGIGGSGGSRASAIMPAPVQIDSRPTPVVAPVLTQTSPVVTTGPQTPTPTLQRTGTNMSVRVLSPVAASPERERVQASIRTRTNSKTLPRGPAPTVTVVSNRTGQ